MNGVEGISMPVRGILLLTDDLLIEVFYNAAASLAVKDIGEKAPKSSGRES